MKGCAGEGFALRKAVRGCFSNDLGIHGIGDPFVLKNAGWKLLFILRTSAPDGFYCWRSEDLVHWTDRKMCYTRSSGSWGVDSFWAPEVVYFGGRYYMYYTARNAGGKPLESGWQFRTGRMVRFWINGMNPSLTSAMQRLTPLS